MQQCASIASAKETATAKETGAKHEPHVELQLNHRFDDVIKYNHRVNQYGGGEFLRYIDSWPIESWR